MDALEAVDGMLLFGISTAYIFAWMQAYWPMLSRRHWCHAHRLSLWKTRSLPQSCSADQSKQSRLELGLRLSDRC